LAPAVVEEGKEPDHDDEKENGGDNDGGDHAR
jgi:hypothetical protein